MGPSGAPRSFQHRNWIFSPNAGGIINLEWALFDDHSTPSGFQWFHSARTDPCSRLRHAPRLAERRSSDLKYKLSEERVSHYDARSMMMLSCDSHNAIQHCLIDRLMPFRLSSAAHHYVAISRKIKACKKQHVGARGNNGDKNRAPLRQGQSISEWADLERQKRAASY